MKRRSLSTKILLVSGLVLVVFGGASFGILYRAQTELSKRTMDSLLRDDSFALSTLVDARPNHEFDFEITALAMSGFQQSQAGEFFRFLNPETGQVYRETPGAPPISCAASQGRSTFHEETHGEKRYLAFSTVFQPGVEEELLNGPPFERGWICLVVGVDQAPYRDFVKQTLMQTVPLLVALILLSIAVLLLLVRGLTRDLSEVSKALQFADFGATHEFPSLPPSRTAEVQAVIEKMQTLHQQAADVYREMWLFLGRAAHQLKTPVTAFQVTLEALMRKERSKEELVSGLTDLNHATELLVALTRKLIVSSRLSYDSNPTQETADLAEFFTIQLKVFGAKAESLKIAIVIEDGESIQVQAGMTLLTEIFGNLIENALLYSPPGSRIRLTWKKDGSDALITVSDQGPGFPPSVRESLFKPFVRGDERLATGSGLGLSIVKKATGILGGDVALRETGPSGSVIAVRLPLSAKSL